jgi:molecular chaperone DnaK
VAAKDRATGKEQSIRIEASSGLNESEIQKMVKDAESHASDDRRRKEEVETRNRADSLAYEVEKNVKEHGGKLDADTKSRVESEVSRVREALKSGDTAAIATASEALQEAWHKAAAMLYQQAAPPPPGGGSPGGGPEPGEKKKEGGDGAVDADYEVMN